jgi:hypothetical protein
VPFPFVDQDGDGLADVRGVEFVADPKFGRDLPEPFAALSEAGVERDEQGRAYGFTADGKVDKSRLLYLFRDTDTTFLAGALREAAKLFDPRSQTAVHVAQLVPALFGKLGDRSKTYGETAYHFQGPDPDHSPAVDLVYASTALLERPVYEQSLQLTQTLLDQQEKLLVGAVQALLTLEKRTRASSDAYPKAALSEHSVLWDDLLFQIERMTRRRKTKDGPTLIELLLRGALGYARNVDEPGQPIERMVSPDVLRHEGALLATLLRFKDEWRNNPKGESERAPGDPAIIGSLHTPVDRSKPDLPVTCGHDGCGGPIAGTLFERWAAPGQVCMLQRDGRPSGSSDCGAPANQSIFQRSMGLIWEMAGRSQCNKPITLGDLLDFAVLKDPCAVLNPAVQCSADTDCVLAFASTDYRCDTARSLCIAVPDSQSCAALKQQQRDDRQNTIAQAEQRVFDDYSCPAGQPDAACQEYVGTYPAAFVDPDGPDTGTPSTLQPCHLLNLPDVGRSFGRALTREFVIEVPNPWMYRYLEDVARAGDPSLKDCDDPSLPPEIQNFDIVDPKTPPPCIPGAARLSRNVYENMLPCDPSDPDNPRRVCTLGGLIEFLLDDSSLFASEQDTKDLRPDVRALTHVLFAPPGSTSFLMFDPLLLHGAPPLCKDAPQLPACPMDDTAALPSGGCCIQDSTNPPFRFRLDTYYGSTSFAWEQPLSFQDGTSLSLIDAMKTLADGVNRTDYDAEAGDDPADFEGTDYLFSTLGKVIAQHYDSPANPYVQNKDPNALNYRSLSNLVSYEDLLADAFDDGTLDPDQTAPQGGGLFDQKTLPSDPVRQLGLIYHSYPLLEKLDEIAIGSGDAIGFSAELMEYLLSPHAYCAPPGGDLRVVGGKGACDMLAAGPSAPAVCDATTPRPKGYHRPLTYRDGRATICRNDGTCLNKPSDCHYASPLYLLLDALDEVDDRIGDSSTLAAAKEGVRAGLFDSYLTTNTKSELSDRRLRALLLVMLDYLRDRWAAESKAGTLGKLAADMVQDSVDLVHNPVFAGGLGMIERLSQHDDAMTALNRFAGAWLGGAKDEGQVRALIAVLSDVLEALPGDDGLRDLVRATASTVLSNASDVVESGAKYSLADGMIWRDVTLLRDVALKDDSGILGTLLNNAVALPGAGTSEERASPMAELYDALLAFNRATPGAKGNLSADDWRSVFQEISGVLLDKRRGFERLYEIVECRNGPTEQLACE